MAILENVLETKLAESQIADLLATTTSFWAVQAPQKSEEPYIVYTVLDDIPVNVMGVETVPTDSLVQVSIYASSFLEIVTIFTQLRTTFKRLSGTINSVVVQDTFYEGRADLFDRDDNNYQRDVTFRFFWEE